MDHIETEVRIQAPPAKVWEVLTQAAKYPEWNPFVVRVRGKLTKGSRILATLSVSGAKLIVPVTVVRFEPGKALAWRGGAFPVFRAEHYFEIYPDGAGTRFVHGETFEGIVPILLGDLGTRVASPAYAALNRALAKRAEAA